jgi:hypothetical protein
MFAVLSIISLDETLEAEALGSGLLLASELTAEHSHIGIACL